MTLGAQGAWCGEGAVTDCLLLSVRSVVTALEGKREGQVPFLVPGSDHDTEPTESSGLWNSGEVPSLLFFILGVGGGEEVPSQVAGIPTTCWSHQECEHEGNFSQWKDFFIASVSQTPPGLLIMNLGFLTSKCIT